jgi:hypothetical protein
VVENPLHAVAVVQVDVQVRHALEPLAQDVDGNRRVVEDAEAAGAVGQRVVQPARDVDGERCAVAHGVGGGDRRASVRQRGFPHAHERRVVPIRREAPAMRVHNRRARAELAHHLDVFGHVNAAQFRLVDGRRRLPVQVRGQPIRLHQGAQQHQPLRFQRVRLAELILLDSRVVKKRRHYRQYTRVRAG